MKKLFITAACIAVTLCSFAKDVNAKKKMHKEVTPSLNAVVTTTGTKVFITAITALPKAIDITMEDEHGNEVYEGKLIKGEYSQGAIYNFDQVIDGTYKIVLQSGKERVEKTIEVNTSTTRQLSVE